MNQPPVLKTALNFGAMSGLASFAMFLLLYYTGFNPLGQISWVGVWIPVVFIVLGTKHYRDHEGLGYISYWQGFRVGFLTASCGAFLFALMVWSFATVIDAQIVERFKQESLMYLEQTEQLSKSMFGEAIYDASVENIEKITTGTISAQEFWDKTFGGLIISLITAAFLRKNNSTPLSNEL